MDCKRRREGTLMSMKQKMLSQIERFIVTCFGDGVAPCQTIGIMT